MNSNFKILFEKRKITFFIPKIFSIIKSPHKPIIKSTFLRNKRFNNHNSSVWSKNSSEFGNILIQDKVRYMMKCCKNADKIKKVSLSRQLIISNYIKPIIRKIFLCKFYPFFIYIYSKITIGREHETI